MLFNTLSYAKFFATVFVVAWLLVNRRWVPLLPWLALAGYSSSHGSKSSLLMTAAGLVVALGLCRSESPRPRLVLASLLANVLGLSLLTFKDYGLDPLSLGLRELDLSIPGQPVVPVLLMGLGLVVLYFALIAKKVRLLFILAASYVFYAHWDYRFLPLIWGSSTADWLLGNAIGRATDPRKRKLWLIGTLVLNLGVLAIFKYFNFGIDSASAVLESLGYERLEVQLRVALPIGISFFTFESMSYVIDVYNRRIQPHKSYFEYLTFVAFFPHLVAGPIVRPRDLLPQLGGLPRFSTQVGSEGLFLIAVGLVKKVAIGDYLAINFIDRVFDSPLSYSALECYLAVVAYAVQIYCDFSGYTDIAIGSALLLGVRFPLNFDAPYKAQNIIDFWRRWHISLSTWLRDYLYIPLGGNRKGPARTYINLMITMLLGGLWHGASFTFVVWGGIHGAALAVTRAFVERRPRAEASTWQRVISVFLTFHLVCAAWIFFRSESFGKAWLMYSQLFSFTTHHANLHENVLIVLALGLISHYIPERQYQLAKSRFLSMPAPVQGVALFAVLLGLKEMSSAEAVPFVYFQF